MENAPASTVEFVNTANQLTIQLHGRLDFTSTAPTWSAIRKVIRTSQEARIVVDASQVSYCDGAAIAMLFRLQQQAHDRPFELTGLPAQFMTLLEQFDPADYQHYPKKHRSSSLCEEVGKASYRIVQDAKRQIAFVGQLSIAFLASCRHLHRVRWRDTGILVERVGFNAIPIVCLIAFILGVILAFQSASSMQQFGAELYVADLIGLSLLRELSPLLTAILLAGRSGAAFTAELGTMKVNEEINALTTMGLEPLQFLVIPRIIAAVLTTPLLIIIADAVGILGGALVMAGFGVPIPAFINEMTGFVNSRDFLVGVGKGGVFGLIIAAIGCMRGLDTQNSADGVGQSTTSAVVTMIVLVVVLDGVFAVLFTQLGI